MMFYLLPLLFLSLVEGKTLEKNLVGPVTAIAPTNTSEASENATTNVFQIPNIDASVVDDVFGVNTSKDTNTNKNIESKVTGHKNGTTEPEITNTEANKVVINSTDSKGAFCESDVTAEKGRCVPYYLCSKPIDLFPESFIDIHVQPDWCESYLDVCCKESNIHLSESTQSPEVPKPERTGCGLRNPEGIDFKNFSLDDDVTRFGEFPWMAAIFKQESANASIQYVGGGSLIHPSVVLTAAHHVDSEDNLKVRLGEWDTQTIKEIYPYQDRDVASVHIHKDYIKKNLFYDIALLFLSTPAELAPNVGIVCLPPPRQKVPEGEKCIASGWLKEQFAREGAYSVLPKKVEVPVVEHRKCQETLRKTRLGDLFMLHSSFMCAGGESGKDTCRGNGGSALVCPTLYEKDRYQQNGIVAWGIGCGENSVPAVYVDVANLRDWIDDKVAGQGYDPKTYST